MGADDKEDSDAPVGTVSVCVVLWDVAGRGGRFWEAAIRLF